MAERSFSLFWRTGGAALQVANSPGRSQYQLTMCCKLSNCGVNVTCDDYAARPNHLSACGWMCEHRAAFYAHGTPDGRTPDIVVKDLLRLFVVVFVATRDFEPCPSFQSGCSIRDGVGGSVIGGHRSSWRPTLRPTDNFPITSLTSVHCGVTLL